MKGGVHIAQTLSEYWADQEKLVGEANPPADVSTAIKKSDFKTRGW